MPGNGPPPTPSKILAMRGSRLLERRPAEPEPEIAAPDPPSFLSVEAAEKWAEVIAHLRELRILSRVDRDSIAQYCEVFTRWRQMAERTKDYKDTIYPLKDKAGNIVGVALRPEVRLYLELGKEVQRLAQQFGLTPASRARVRVEGREPDAWKKDKRAFLNLGEASAS